MESNIPMVDFSVYSIDKDTTSEDELANLGEEIFKAFTEVGFCYVHNHGVSQHLISDAFRFSKEFFDLPLTTKEVYARSTSHFDHEGYYSPERESTDPANSDLKEVFNFLLNSNPKRLPMDVLPQFKESMDKLYIVLRQLAFRVMDTMAVGLKLEDTTFFRKHHKFIGRKGNNSTLRTLYYTPVKDYKNGQLRCGEHSDYGFLSFLLQDTVAGLEVKNTKGEYIPVDPVEGTIVVIASDLIQRWTSDKIITSKHRVVVPEAKEMQSIGRQSLVFFMQPDDEALIEEIDSVGKYEPITSGEYLLQKLTQTQY